MKTSTCFAWGLLSLLAGLVTGCQAPTGPAPSSAASPQDRTASEAATLSGATRSAESLPAHFQATVYEVRASAERLGGLDGKALARAAATAEGLQKALARVGTTRTIYRFDQPVNVLAETLRIGTREPIVTGTRSAPGGGAINTVQYQEVGATVRLSAKAPLSGAKRGSPDVKLSLELAVLVDSEVTIAPGRKVASVRHISMEHSEGLELGQPRVWLAVSSTSADPQQLPAAYVVRYQFSRPGH